MVHASSRFPRPAALIVLLALLPAMPGPWAGAGLVSLPAPAPGVFDRIDPGVRVPPPRIRVALTRVPRPVEIGTSGGGAPRILDGETGREIVPEGFARGPVRVVAVGGNPSAGEEVHRVQVGSFRSEAAARALAEELEQDTGEPADVRWDAARGVWRVRVGEAAAAEPLRDLLRSLRLRWPDAWVTREEREVLAGARLGLVGPRWRTFDPAAQRLVFVAPAGQHLTAGGRPYRGVLEAFLSRGGEVVLVNELNLEDYLRGVVPEELGPAAWPEIEALKAQAVAARTYALGNRGQYAEEGYDLCDTPRCQVYGGMGSEHPLSDRAVRETAGEFLAYGDRPINALYTSTCGGHTEDASVVFPEMDDAPWLRGVPCIPDEEALLAGGRRVPGRPFGGEEGTVPATRDAPDPLDLALLLAHNVVESGAMNPAWRAEPVEPHQVSRWVAALARRAGLPAPPPFVGKPTRLAIWRHVRLVFSGEGLDAALGPGDERALLTPRQLAELPEDGRRLVAGLVARGWLRPGPDGLFRPGEVPARDEVIALLGRVAGRLDALPFHRGTVERGAPDRLVLRERRTSRSFPLRMVPPMLFARTGGRWHPVRELVFWPGDRVLWVAAAGEQLDLLALEERRSLADDRFSRHYRWTVSRTRKEIEASLAGVAPVGHLLNIRVLRRGVSGRVAAIELVGTAGRAVVEGFRLRRALGLRETLFSMLVQHDPDGLVRRVVFDGRGWGHGVGMCQVGAYGMAARGADYREILHHYYTGVRLVRFQPGGGRR